MSPIHPSLSPPIHRHLHPAVHQSILSIWFRVCVRPTSTAKCLYYVLTAETASHSMWSSDGFRLIPTAFVLFATGWSSHSACSKESHRDNSPICEPRVKPAIMCLPSVLTALTGWTQPTLTCVCFVSFSYFGVFDSGHYPSSISHRLQQPRMNRLRDNWFDVYFIMFSGWNSNFAYFVPRRF